MKIKGGKQVHYDSGPNMTPLVDIVMVILIFLMLAGSFGGTTNFLSSKQGIKAHGGMGRPLKPGEVPDIPLEIRVVNRSMSLKREDQQGFVTHGPGVEGLTDPDQLLQVLTKKRLGMEAAGTKSDKVLVVITPTDNTLYQYLIDVYQSALKAGFEKIAFATTK